MEDISHLCPVIPLYCKVVFHAIFDVPCIVPLVQSHTPSLLQHSQLGDLVLVDVPEERLQHVLPGTCYRGQELLQLAARWLRARLHLQTRLLPQQQHDHGLLQRETHRLDIVDHVVAPTHDFEPGALSCLYTINTIRGYT